MEELSERIKKLRKQKNMSVVELAGRVGVNRSTLREWENGRKIMGEPYIKMAEALNISINELLTGKQLQIEKDLLQIEECIARIRAMI